ncbi:MAG: oligosaccharide flippase family protein [Bacteroidetes bacterium]|nr:oligosaccharide flippase family protein [Bacteroidota bacterium]
MGKLFSRINELLTDSHQRELFIKSYKNLTIRILGRILSYLLVYAIIKIYGGEAFGQWSIITSIFLLSQMILNLGIKTSIVRYFAEYNEEKINLKNLYQKAIVVLFFTSLLGAFAINLLVSDIAIAYSKPYIVDYLPIVLLGIFPLNIVELNAGVFKGLRNTEKFSILDSISKPFFILLFILIAFSFNSSFLFVFELYLASIVLIALLSFFMIYKCFKVLTINKGRVVPYKELFSVSIPMFFTESLNSLLRWVDILILGFYCSDVLIGAYSLAVRLTNLVTIPLLSVNSIATPKFRELFVIKDFKKLKAVVLQSNKMIFQMAIIPSVILLFANEFILEFFESDYAIAKWSLIILALGQLVNVATGAIGQLLNMTGGHKILALVSAISTGLNLILNFWLIPIYGITGAAISTAIAIIVNNLLSTIIIKHRLGFFSIYIPFKKQ